MIQKMIRNKTILAFASIALGIYLMIARGTLVNSLISVIGYALIGIGLAYVLLYLLNKNRRDRVQLGYACGAALCGLAVTWLAPSIVNFFPRLMGIALIVVGVSNLTAARDNVYSHISRVGPILTIALGVLVFINPGAIVSTAVLLAGIALVLNGLSELELIRKIW